MNRDVDGLVRPESGKSTGVSMGIYEVTRDIDRIIEEIGKEDRLSPAPYCWHNHCDSCHDNCLESCYPPCKCEPRCTHDCDDECECEWHGLCAHDCSRPDHDLERLGRLAKELQATVRGWREIARADLYRQQDGLCNGCKYPNPMAYLDVDHIVPRAKGGKDAFGNLQLLCGKCNSKKGTDSMDVFVSKLIKEGVRKTGRAV